MLETIAFKSVLTPNADARIVKAALRYGEIVYTDVRHSYIFQAVIRLQIYDRLTIGNADQGFVDQYGNFFSRHDASKIAFKAKQVLELRKELFSEDIFHNDGSFINP